MAVDNSKGVSAGEVYVVEGRAVGVEGGAVDVFKPEPNPEHPDEVGEGEGAEGQYLRRLSGAKLEGPNGIAVSASTGRVLVADSAKGAVYAFNAEGVYEEKLSGTGSPYGSFGKGAPVGDVAGVAVDGGSGDVYVAEAERHVVSQYGASGEWEGWITTTPAGDLGEPRGVALSGAGEVFVADGELGMVDRFGAGMVVPTVETGKVAKSVLTRTTVVLPGSINGEGEVAEYRFQYGETEALGFETATQGSGVGLQAVSAMVEGLHAGRSYFYRIVGEDAGGTSYGLIREVQTPAAVEGLATGSVESVGPEAATLTGSLKRGGLQTHYYFQYGTSEAYGSQSPEPPGEVPPAKKKEEAGKDSSDGRCGSFREHLLSLSSRRRERIWHDLWAGSDVHDFRTAPDCLSADHGDRPDAGHDSRDGRSRPALHDVSLPVWRNELLRQRSAAGRRRHRRWLQRRGGLGVSSGIEGGRDLSLRVVAENEAGITTGVDETFTTVSSAPVDATYATGVGVNEATLHTQINPLGNDTHYYFQYGTQSCQANPSACTSIRRRRGKTRVGHRRRGARSEVERAHAGSDISLSRA